MLFIRSTVVWQIGAILRANKIIDGIQSRWVTYFRFLCVSVFLCCQFGVFSVWRSFCYRFWWFFFLFFHIFPFFPNIFPFSHFFNAFHPFLIFLFFPKVQAICRVPYAICVFIFILLFLKKKIRWKHRIGPKQAAKTEKHENDKNKSTTKTANRTKNNPKRPSNLSN